MMLFVLQRSDTHGSTHSTLQVAAVVEDSGDTVVVEVVKLGFECSIYSK